MVEIIFREIAMDTEGNIYQGERTMRIDGLEKGMKEKRGEKSFIYTEKKKKEKYDEWQVGKITFDSNYNVWYVYGDNRWTFPPLLYIFSTFTFKVLPVKRNLHKKEIVSPVLKGALCYFTLYAVLFYSFQNLHSPTLFSPRLWTININVNAARWKWILSFVDRVSLVPLF